MSSYSKKTKCQGCKALCKKKEDGKDVYYCALNIPITFISEGSQALAPVPLQKCHKPKSDKEFNSLRREMNKKQKEVVTNEA